jgi:predicted secreted protein
MSDCCHSRITRSYIRLRIDGDVAPVDMQHLCMGWNLVSEIAPAKRMKSLSSFRLKKMDGKRISLAALLLSISILSIYGIPGLHAAETVTVNRAFNKREIKVRVGSTIRLELEQLGTAGYVWKVQNLDGEHLEILKEQTMDAPSPGDITGAPVMKTWLIRANKAGRSELKLVNCRSWEDEKNPSDTFVLRALIVP